MTNWPDPARSGVPLNPGVPGAHWLKGYTEDAWMYDSDGGWWGPGYSHKLDAETVAARYSYLGPCLTPDEAAALQARADRNAAGFARVDAEAERAKFLHKQEIAALQKRVAELEGALREMVYEATHLSPEEDDGSHWCKINKGALVKARAALTGGKDE